MQSGARERLAPKKSSNRLKQAVQRLANALIIIDNGNDGALATHRASLTGWKTELKDCPIRNARQSADASTVRLDDGPTD